MEISLNTQHIKNNDLARREIDLHIKEFLAGGGKIEFREIIKREDNPNHKFSINSK